MIKTVTAALYCLKLSSETIHHLTINKKSYGDLDLILIHIHSEYSEVFYIGQAR